ncbi:aldehyde ferredoxin oxidoreductase N-terminal domain-containing protein [Actinoplanes solisilvae]|uniref:aldehyde ferredoxin oxidoreductase N-terminal domain-containing protein n=1 Tax=Actinoplanes solisilvae TaxID=2486853 RepID=UPI000FD6C266|nr:aldehyde ferredoxin oxidoreductase N-terminal domain-containing protein [Actinoplanes solisilvae]
MGLIPVSLDGSPTPAVPDDPDDFDGPVAALRHLLAALTGPVDPVDAPIALVAGVVAGAGAPGTARCAAVGLSPLNGGVAETRAEGPYAAGMRAAGVTGVVLHGRAPMPVCVVVSDGGARLEPAGDLWGLSTGVATDRLLERYGADAAVAVIGPAGERGVLYASIVTCRHHPLPRLGLGAVLGGKNVKAVVCVGSSRPPVADPVSVRDIAAEYSSLAAVDGLSTWQREWPGFGVWTGAPGYAPVAQFTDTTRGGGVGSVPPEISRSVAPCPGCPTNCIKVYAGAGLHQEALAALDVADPWPLLSVHEQEGTDPVSASGTLTVRGVAIPPFDPRVQPNLGLAYVVAPIGPRYDIVEHDLDFDPIAGIPSAYPELAKLGVSVPRPRGEFDVWRTAQLMRLWSGLDALGVCLFASTPTRPLTLERVGDLVTAISGLRPDVLELGATRMRLQHEVNVRVGRATVETLPELFFTSPVQAGEYAGAVLDRSSFEAAAAALRDELGLI